MRFTATSQAVSRPSTEPAVRAACSAQCADPSERDRAAVGKVQEKQNICLQSITNGYIGCSRHCNSSTEHGASPRGVAFNVVASL